MLRKVFHNINRAIVLFAVLALAASLGSGRTSRAAALPRWNLPSTIETFGLSPQEGARSDVLQSTDESERRALLRGQIIRSDSPNESVPRSSGPEYPARAITPMALTGNIAFETDRSGLFDIYVKDANENSLAVPLVTSPGNDATPVWSPDGTQMAFASDRDGDFDIYLRTNDGVERNLTQNAADDAHPSWSPAGDRILFTSDRGGSYFQIYTMRIDGSDMRQVGSVPSYNAMAPTFSPDGSRIAYMRASVTAPLCQWNWDVWVMDAEGQNQQQVTHALGADLYPEWTPDGREIVHASCRYFIDFDLYAINPDTGVLRQLNSWFSSDEWGAIFSPDAGHIAFNTNIDGNTDIYFGPSSGPFSNLTQNDAEDLAASWGMNSAPTTYSISGRVDDSDGNSVPGVSISDDKGHSAVTNSDGRYSLVGLAPGTYVLTPIKAGWTFTPASRTVIVPPSTTGQDFVVGRPDCDLIKQPVLFVHGWGGTEHDRLDEDTSGFEKLYRWMRQDGYVEGCNCFWATGVQPTNSREQNRVAIQSSLRQAYNVVKGRNPSWDGHFDIIGHSYGGLNARFYLESRRYVQDMAFGIRVDNLFTLGSPHGGVNVPSELYPGTLAIAWEHTAKPKNVREFLSAARLLSPDMELYNRTHRQSESLCYRLLGGNFMVQPLPWALDLLYSPWVDSPNDIGVSQRSSLRLGMDQRYLSRQYPNVVTDASNIDMHGYAEEITKTVSVPLVGDIIVSIPTGHLRSYVHPSATYEDSIAPVLGADAVQCSAIQHITTYAAATPEPVGSTALPVLVASPTVTEGQVITGTVSVDWEGSMPFYAVSGGGELDLALRDPAGTVFTPTVALMDPNADYFVASLGASGLVGYAFTSTLTGEWTYTVTASSGPYPTVFDLYMVPDSALVARTSSQDWNPFGTPVFITATVYNSVTPVSGAVVEADVTRPDGSVSSTGLHDDGIAPDDSAGDGIYSGIFTDTFAGGYYFILTQVEGVQNALPYYRTAQAVFAVSSADAALSGSYADWPEDVDRDGLLYENLVVDAGVIVSETGSYLLAAVLESSEGDFVDLANTPVGASSGTQTVSLRFSGKAIRKAGYDGPYTVTQVLLVDDDDTTLKLDEASNALVTAAYDHRLFGEAKRVYLPTVLSDYVGP